jgi:hypothetical protein
MRLPPVLEELPAPVPPVLPHAIIPFRQDKRFARLRRGKKVMEISNQALRESGLFTRAINSSQTLSRGFQDFQAATLRLQQFNAQFNARRAPLETNLSMAESQVLEARRAIARGENADEQLAAAQQAKEAAITELKQWDKTYNALLFEQSTKEAIFEDALWDIGLNGAKVATVSRADEPSVSDARDDVHVLIQAMGSAPNNNCGYAVTRVKRNGQFGITTVPSEYLLPLPVDANDLFVNQVGILGTQRAPDGVMLELSDDSLKNPIAQVIALPRFGLVHDTGYLVGAGNFAQNVSLMSRLDPQAGQSIVLQAGGDKMTELVPVDVALNTQIMDIGGQQSVQFFTVANNDLDPGNLRVEHMGVRAYNRSLGSFFEGWSVTVATTQSVFGETSYKPTTLDSSRGTLIGTIDRRGRTLKQANLSIPVLNCWNWKMAIEEPWTNDVLFYPAGAGQVQLTRWPTFATNLTWTDSAQRHSLHLGGLLRNHGFQQNDSQLEDFAAGWGLSAIGKIGIHNTSNFFGIVGGDGVGDYIQGISTSAVASETDIFPLRALGLFAGHQMVWRDQFAIPISELNLGYGYALMEAPEVDGADLDRRLHQVFANYTWFLTDHLALGAEYQYGHRHVRSGDVGENHRFMLLLAIRSDAPKRSTIVESFYQPRESRVPVEQNDPRFGPGLDADLHSLQGASDASSTAMRTLEPKGTTVGSRPVEDVVNQFQRGGPAYLQKF